MWTRVPTRVPLEELNADHKCGIVSFAAKQNQGRTSGGTSGRFSRKAQAKAPDSCGFVPNARIVNVAAKHIQGRTSGGSTRGSCMRFRRKVKGPNSYCFAATAQDELYIACV